VQKLNVVAYWRFFRAEAGDSVFLDRSGSKFHGTLWSAPYLRCGHGVDLNADEAVVTVPDTSYSLYKTPLFTVEASIMPHVLDKKFSYAIVSHEGWELRVNVCGPLFVYTSKISKEIYAHKEPIIEIGKWAHIAAVHKENQTLLYVNGKRITPTVEVGCVYDGHFNLEIGRPIENFYVKKNLGDM